MSAHKFVPSSLDATTCSGCGLDVNDPIHKSIRGAGGGRGEIPMRYNHEGHLRAMLERIERHLALNHPQLAHKLVLELLELHSLRSQGEDGK